MRKIFLVIWLCVIAAGVSGLFWFNEWKYNLPTPVPKDYVSVPAGKYINVYNNLISNKDGKPLFIHFFNPDCPCSRFNIPQFIFIEKKYRDEVNFVIVVMSDKKFTIREIQNKFNLNIPVIFDTTIAEKCGVYSTPQAVILNERHQLFYRGNYNKSRYCADPATNYAQIALSSLLSNNAAMIFNNYALNAYGCELPKNVQQ